MKNMQMKIFFHVIIIMLIVIAVNSKGDLLSNCIWGVATNNVKLGIDITSFHMGKDTPPTCILYIKNITTNVAQIGLRFPKPPTRFNRVELLGPNGLIVNLKPEQHIADFDGVIRTHLYTNGVDQLGYFSIPDNFEIKTNGQYQLIVSLNASTNVWGHDTNYFAFPPVTNTFSISTNELTSQP